MKRGVQQLGTALLVVLAGCCSRGAAELAPVASESAVEVEYGAGGVIFPASRGQQVAWLGFEGARSFWTPGLDDVRAFEAGFIEGLQNGSKHPERISEYAVGRPDYQDWVRGRVDEILGRIDDYRRQYVGVVDEAGKCQLLVRAFPGAHTSVTFPFEAWHEELAVVSDGGSWYWYVLYDVESGELSHFTCNGEA